jgi:hypothetical protein
MTAEMQRSGSRNRPDVSVHRFEVGQAVRLKGSFVKFVAGTSDVYRITGTLPPKENSPQYRIRNEGERHERVTTQDDIEAVDISQAGNGATLIERTFDHGQGTETQ